MKKLILFALIIGLSQNLSANEGLPKHRLDAGIRSMKFVGFYWLNGLSAEYSSEKILDHKIQFGLNMVSSLAGSAFLTNAIPTTQFELSVIKHFRHGRSFQPLIRLNTGFAHANYRDAQFDNLPQNGMLLSTEFGLSYRLPFMQEKLSLKACLGYNIFSGNGITGLSTVFPVYSQFSVLYRLR
jgi:hypothetical protein